MRKLSSKLAILTAFTLLIVSCAKEPDLGTVTLDPSSRNVTFGQVFTIKPIFSTTGEAQNKTYTWKSSADSIVSVKAVSGGFGEVTPKRIGQAIITFSSTDSKITKTATITVDPRSTILNGIYYAKGATESSIRNNMTAGFNYSEAESSPSFLVFNSSGAAITKLIYELDTSKNLKAVYAVLNNTAENKKSAEQYIEERFMNTNKAQGGILFYKNTGFIATTAVPVNTVLGVFIDATVNSVQYPLGVKIMDAGNL